MEIMLIKKIEFSLINLITNSCKIISVNPDCFGMIRVEGENRQRENDKYILLENHRLATN